MSTSNAATLAGKLVVWLIVGILAIAALKIVFSIFRFAVGLAVFLLVVVGPILLLGWLGMKAYRHLRSDPAY